MTERLHFHFLLSCIGEGNGNPLYFLAWRIPGSVEPDGRPSLGSHRVGHDWSDLAAAALCTYIYMKTVHTCQYAYDTCMKTFGMMYTKRCHWCWLLLWKRHWGSRMHGRESFSLWSLNYSLCVCDTPILSPFLPHCLHLFTKNKYLKEIWKCYRISEKGFAIGKIQSIYKCNVEFWNINTEKRK